MINTINFKTKTILSERNNPVRGDVWNIGLDIGYSSVKGFSPNAVSCFPAFAKKASDTPSMAAPKPTDIQYRNDITGEIWDVGENAQNRATANDSEVLLGNVPGNFRSRNGFWNVEKQIWLSGRKRNFLADRFASGTY